MPNFFKPLTRSLNWITRRNRESVPPSCASVSCSRPSLWHRLRHRSAGTFLQGVFYCRPQCLETALIGQLSRLRIMAPSPPPPNRIPLGLLMVARGKLTYLEVRAALEAQRRARYGKIGDWIEKLGFATEQEVTTAWPCNGDARSLLPSIRPPSSLRATSAAHPRSLSDASPQLCGRDQHPLRRFRRTGRSRRSLRHRKDPRLPHPALRCRTQKNRPSARIHAPTAAPCRRGIRTHE